MFGVSDKYSNRVQYITRLYVIYFTFLAGQFSSKQLVEHNVEIYFIYLRLVVTGRRSSRFVNYSSLQAKF